MIVNDWDMIVNLIVDVLVFWRMICECTSMGIPCQDFVKPRCLYGVRNGQGSGMQKVGDYGHDELGSPGW